MGVADAVVADVVEEADVAETKASAKNTGKTLKMLKITWVRSQIGYPKDQRATIESLGLHRLNQTVEHEDTPQVRGQIFKVKHMLNVEEV